IGIHPAALCLWVQVIESSLDHARVQQQTLDAQVAPGAPLVRGRTVDEEVLAADFYLRQGASGYAFRSLPGIAPSPSACEPRPPLTPPSPRGRGRIASAWSRLARLGRG